MDLEALGISANERGTFELSPERFGELLDNEKFLGCLIVCGVDTWEGYSEALHTYNFGRSNDA
jgi:hypothetical protein